MVLATHAEGRWRAHGRPTAQLAARTTSPGAVPALHAGPALDSKLTASSSDVQLRLVWHTLTQAPAPGHS